MSEDGGKVAGLVGVVRYRLALGEVGRELVERGGCVVERGGLVEGRIAGLCLCVVVFETGVVVVKRSEKVLP